jgi:alpha-beta hydrolase superfamily lysophospholipase
MNTLAQRNEVAITIGNKVLKGQLNIPEKASGLVLFSHGSGSSRHSPRNQYVAEILEQNGLATFLFDLLTETEDRLYENRFDIDLLTERLIEVTKWVGTEPATSALPLCYYGASTGAASALRAAAHFGSRIKAVVSRGGRPDLALAQLPQVTSPTLLIVGGWDHVVIALNDQAYQKLRCPRKMEIIPEASHLFEEPGKLEEVARKSVQWFTKWLQKNTDEHV